MAEHTSSRAAAHTRSLSADQVRTSCAHDCGGKCLLLAHVANGRVVKISGDPVGQHQHHLEPCVRGLRYAERVHHPDRLLQPLIRRGPRGSGDFRTATWDEALALVAGRLGEARARWGPGGFLCMGRTGSLSAHLHETRQVTSRFFSLFGGHLGITGNYSWGAAAPATVTTYGTTKTASSRFDLLNSKFILIWGWDPVVTVLGSHTAWVLREAKRRGIPMVVVDPRRSPTAALADEWVPIRPGSDVALLNALAFELIRNGWHDEAFLSRHAVGFAEYAAYLLGDEDGVPKTPEWQEPITGVSADRARRLAREYGTRRPAALMPGWAPQRSRQGEQFHRATAALATLAGNVGVSGGSAAGIDRGPGPVGEAILPVPPNPYPETVPLYRWADCVLNGSGGGYPSQPRVMYVVGANPLSSHADTHKTARAMLALDFVVTHDHFLTPSARFSDVVLPATTFLERNDFHWPYDGMGQFYVAQNQAIPPQGSTRNDFDVMAEMADRLGFGAAYTEGRNEDQWLRWLAARAGIPDFDAFMAAGVHWTVPHGPDGDPEGAQPHVAFQVRVEGGNAFKTPSGRIEIYSAALAQRGDPLVPAVPKYLDLPEGPTDPLRSRFPLQLLSPKSKFRINSTLDRLLTDDQAVLLHPDDAASRGLTAGQVVKVWNDRGVCRVPLQVTVAVMSGVAVLSAGAWVRWDQADGAGGDDTGGCPNTLIGDEGTAWGQSATQQSVLVQVASS